MKVSKRGNKGNIRTNKRQERRGHKKPTGREKGPAQTPGRDATSQSVTKRDTTKYFKSPPKSSAQPQKSNWVRPPLPKKDDPMFRITQVDPFKLLLSVENPRTDFSSPKEKKGLAELAASILEHDIIEPLIITPIEFVPKHIVETSIEYTNNVFKAIGQKEPKYTHVVIAGERRLQATMSTILEYMKKWGDSVPCKVRVSDSESARLAVMFAENMHRSDVNAMDRAKHLKKLFDAMKLEKPDVKQVDLSNITGIDQSQISTLFRLLEFPEDVQKRVYDRVISPVMANQLMQVDGRTRAKFFRLMDKGEIRPSEITLRLKVIKAERNIENKRRSGKTLTQPVGRPLALRSTKPPWKKKPIACLCPCCPEKKCPCHPESRY